MCVPVACVPEKRWENVARLGSGGAALACDGRKRRGTAAVLLRCDVRQHVALVNLDETKTCANALIKINLD
jgi:hypothetical protein